MQSKLRYIGLASAILSIALLSAIVTRPAAAADARVWLSTTPATSGPQAPAVVGIEGTVQTLHVWAQPATIGGGAFNAGSNPFKLLQNFSLIVDTTNPVVDFLDDGIVVHNPLLGGTTRRFEFVTEFGPFDNDPQSNLLQSDFTEAQVLAGDADRIGGQIDRGLQGFTVSADGAFTGVGGAACSGGDPFCVTTSGGPAWQLASLDFRTLEDSGMTQFFLQIGANGMSHFDEESSDFNVTFGSLTGAPVYNGSTNRNDTLPSDSADLTLTAAPPLLGDYSLNGRVDAADYVVWRNNQNQNVTLPGQNPAATTPNVVDQEDYNFWKLHFGETAGSGTALADSSSSLTIPEPSALILVLASFSGLLACRRR